MVMHDLARYDDFETSCQVVIFHVTANHYFMPEGDFLNKEVSVLTLSANIAVINRCRSMNIVIELCETDC